MIIGTASAVLLQTTPANAAELSGAITDVSVTPITPVEGSQLTTDVRWSVPDGSQPGDTFSLRLSDHMRDLPGDFVLTDPATGETVATATVAPQAPYTVDFTLSDYVLDHHSVSGTAYIRAAFDGVGVPSGVPTAFTSTTNDGSSFTSTLTPGGPVFGNGAAPSKYGTWTSSDQGHTDAADAVSWNVDTPLGPFSSAETIDTLPAGQSWDCGQLTLQDGTVDAAGDFVASRDVTPRPPVVGTSPYYTCDADTIDVRWAAEADYGAGQQHRYRLAATASLDAPTGAGTSVTLTNSADVTTTPVGGSPVSQVASASLMQPSDGGEGAGLLEAAAAAPGAAAAPAGSTASAATGSEATATAGDTTVVSTTSLPELAATGSDVAPIGLVGAGLLTVGGALTLLARRRTRQRG